MTYEETRSERLEVICRTKKHYPTKKQATKIAAKLRKRYGNSVFAYKCPACGDGWLHTTQPQRQSDITRSQRGQRAPLAPPHPSTTERGTA